VEALWPSLAILEIDFFNLDQKDKSKYKMRERLDVDISQ
jgi:hypothetical protein